MGWPTSGVTSMEGVVVGWRLKDTICVVGIVGDWVRSDRSMLAKILVDTPLSLRTMAPSCGEVTYHPSLRSWEDLLEIRTLKPRKKP